MKRMKIGIFVLAALLAFGVAARAADTYEIDPVHSSAIFTVGHLQIGQVRGWFPDIAGTITYDRTKPAADSIDVTIKTDSITTFVEKRDEDLKSERFFDVAKYPAMAFKSTKAAKMKNGDYKITGDFTLHGVTKKITITAQLLGAGKGMQGEYRAGFRSDFTIKRSDYGMTTMIPGAGDKVDISVVFEGIKK